MPKLRRMSASPQLSKRIRLALALPSIFVMLSVVLGMAADNCPFKLGDDRQNSQYPEVDSSCVHYTYYPDRVKVWVEVQGSQFPTRDTDPVCSDLAHEVICRRICIDLPAGKQFGGIRSTAITPPDYARFELTPEVFDKGDHYRLCLRVKNWGNEGFRRGTTKTFIYEASYAPPAPSASRPATSAPVAPEWPKQYKVAPGDSLAIIAERHYGRQVWLKIYLANARLIKNPHMIYPDQVLILPRP